MASLAIFIGNSSYKSQSDLPCCERDVEAIKELIEATGRYDFTSTFLNFDADQLKDGIRNAVDLNNSLDDILFFFSGHGYQYESEFYYCAPNFDTRRPNETGLSNSDLHDLLRPASPNLLVKVIDACHSGTLLIKRDDGRPSVDKSAFKNVIQISSCLDNQVSLTGDPLSEFTRNFCEASLVKSSGSIYYTDIMASLRDAYIDNESQTPHFISQSTGRELFADDAHRLDTFRQTFASKWTSNGEDEAAPNEVATVADSAPKTRFELIQSAEKNLATPDDMEEITGDIFDGIKSKLDKSEFSDLYKIEISEYDKFHDENSRGFIIRTLHKEDRPDDFVTADIVRKRKRRRPWDIGFSALSAFMDDDDFDETWDLRLNCKLPRAQIQIAFQPKFKILQKLTLSVTCAPSLERCYVFEVLASHKRTDFDSFEEFGKILVKRWYKQNWQHDTEWLVNDVVEKLRETIDAYIDQTANKL